MYTPGLRAVKPNVACCPGEMSVASAPPPWPLTACRSMLWGIRLVGWFCSVKVTKSPSRPRILGPGPLPPKAQKRHSTPSASSLPPPRVSSAVLPWPRELPLRGARGVVRDRWRARLTGPATEEGQPDGDDDHQGRGPDDRPYVQVASEVPHLLPPMPALGPLSLRSPGHGRTAVTRTSVSRLGVRVQRR